jgi:hypothetical protein
MEDNYKGRTETEHLIRQAAHEVGLEAFECKASTDEKHIGEYSVTFKDKRGDDREVFIPMDAQFLSIVAALKLGKAGKS